MIYYILKHQAYFCPTVSLKSLTVEELSDMTS